MPLITIGAGYTELEPGTYPVTLTRVVEKTIAGQVTEFNPSGEDQQVFEWTFNVDSDDDEVIEVQGLSSTKTGQKSKLSAFITALAGPDALKPGSRFELNDLLGKSALATVGLNKNGYPRVEGLTALPKKAKAKPKPVEDDEDEAPVPTPIKRKPIAAQVADEDDADLPF